MSNYVLSCAKKEGPCSKMRVNINELLYRAMDAAALRQKVIANNVANANTPGFKRSYVTFEEHIQDALAKRKISPQSFAPKIMTDRSTSMRDDGNNVDLDQEMVLMSANGIKYQALSQQINDRLSLMRYVINDGRR